MLVSRESVATVGLIFEDRTQLPVFILLSNESCQTCFCLNSRKS